MRATYFLRYTKICGGRTEPSKRGRLPLFDADNELKKEIMLDITR
jgi:hypothetical protein